MLSGLLSRKIKKKERIEDPSKRRLFRGHISNKQVMRLPWVISEAVFTSGCTQCEKCISSCESNIIIKDEDGFPKIDFSQGECTFCNKCIDSCEPPLFSGRFLNNDVEGYTKINTQNNTKNNVVEQKHKKAWPVTIEISDKCLAKNNIYCQSCRDECETSVIKFSYLDSSIPQPSLNDLDCTQCGACLKTCPQNAIAFNLEPAVSTST